MTPNPTNKPAKKSELGQPTGAAPLDGLLGSQVIGGGMLAVHPKAAHAARASWGVRVTRFLEKMRNEIDTKNADENGFDLSVIAEQKISH